MSLLKTPKTQLGFFLTTIFITAFLNNPSQKIIIIFLSSLLASAISDLLFLKLRKIKLFFPSASLVTGSIIALLTSPYASWYIPVAIGIIAMFSKNFIRFSNRHIFNPAGFGLLVGTIFFKDAISWWGVSFQQFFPQSGISLRETIFFIILLSPAFVSMLRMKRFRITLSFLATYILISHFLNPKSSILNLITDPTVLFFSILMLPEPLTSPNNRFRQIIFGIFAGLVSLTVSSSIFNFQFSIFNSTDPLILSLLLANLVFFKFR